MPRATLLEQMRAVQMARAYCLLIGKDPDEVVPGYIRDVAGRRHRVSKARWRWYHGIRGPLAAGAPAHDPERI